MTRVPVPEGFHTVVVASDGIWDVAEPQDVAAAVRMGAAGAKDRALEG
jgi:serine/threonine protein phosphatase PrpC